MGRFTRTLGPLVSITGALGLWLVVVVTLSASAAPQQQEGTLMAKTTAPTASAAKTAPAKAAAAQPGYVGEETCLTCHEDMKKVYGSTPHARARDPRSPAAAQGCETCHGPGQAHVEGGGDKTKIKNPRTMTPKEVSELCTTCHNRGNQENWQGSKHDSRDLTCTTCHTVHAPKSEKSQLKTETVQETCVQCHRSEVNKVHRSSHMPVGDLNGQKMECTSCHNPHGSNNVHLLKAGTSVNEACVSCHAEKRGPFLWDHAPVREGCTTCHDAHGSNNERMLVAKLPMLCQRCHVSSRHPATIYDQTQVNNLSNRVAGRSCVQCHTMIHGSNHPSGNFFLR